MRKTWWHVSGKELDADEREWEIDRKRCWWESQRSIEKVADEREQDGECLITWGKCGPSEAPADPFLSFLGFRVACFSFFFVKTRTIPFYVFVCCLSTLSIHWAVPQISFAFCFLSSCGLCLCSWLLQLPLLVFFCQRDIQSFFCHQAIPSYLSSLYLWKLRSALEYLQYR